MRIWILVLAMSGAVKAQDHVIRLSNEPPPLENVDFCVDTVLDVRMERADIGMAQVGFMNKKVRARFESDFETELTRFLKKLMPCDGVKPALIIRVHALEITEKTTLATESAVAVADVEFLRQGDDGTEASLYRTQSFVQKYGMDVTQFHKKNIEELLRECVTKFASAPPDTGNRNDRGTEADSVRALPPTSLEKVAADRKSKTIIMASFVKGMNGEGASVQWITYDRGRSTRQSPLVVSCDMIRVRNDKYEGNFVTFGFSKLLLKIKPESTWCWALGFSVPAGSESVDEGSGAKTRFFVGLGLRQSLMLVPTNSGIAIEFGFFEQGIFNSKLYPWDVGIRAGAGIQL